MTTIWGLKLQSRVRPHPILPLASCCVRLLCSIRIFWQYSQQPRLLHSDSFLRIAFSFFPYCMSPSTLANKIEGTIFPILVTSGQPIVEKEMSLLVSPNLTSSFTDSQCSQITLAKSPCGETMASTMASFVARFRQRLHAGCIKRSLRWT